MAELGKQHCIVCNKDTSSPCLSGDSPLEGIGKKLSMCKECGKEITQLSQYYSDNPVATKEDDFEPNPDDAHPNIPFATWGQIHMFCAWCGRDAKESNKLYNVRILYQFEQDNKKHVVYTGIGSLRMHWQWLHENQPAFLGALFACDKCGSAASELTENSTI